MGGYYGQGHLSVVTYVSFAFGSEVQSGLADPLPFLNEGGRGEREGLICTNETTSMIQDKDEHAQYDQ